jgi:hypothetical protein
MTDAVENDTIVRIERVNRVSKLPLQGHIPSNRLHIRCATTARQLDLYISESAARDLAAALSKF